MVEVFVLGVVEVQQCQWLLCGVGGVQLVLGILGFLFLYLLQIQCVWCKVVYVGVVVVGGIVFGVQCVGGSDYVDRCVDVW